MHSVPETKGVKIPLETARHLSSVKNSFIILFPLKFPDMYIIKGSWMMHKEHAHRIPVEMQRALVQVLLLKMTSIPTKDEAPPALPDP